MLYNLVDFLIADLNAMEEECKSFPITINIEGDIKKIEIVRTKCKTPAPPPPTPPRPDPPRPKTPTPPPPDPIVSPPPECVEGLKEVADSGFDRDPVATIKVS